MVNGLLGEKIGMTQIFSDDGKVLPITLIKAGPCSVLHIKTIEKDGYFAIQLGYDDKKKKRATKPELGHVGKSSTGPYKFIKEVKSESDVDIKLGQRIALDVFGDVKKVDVISATKGKGFAGVVKRWNAKGGPATHGSTRHRSAGSIGAGTDPGRVMKGKKMPGRLGGKRMTVKNLEVVKIDKNKNILFVKGAVPGYAGSYLVVRKIV